MKNIQTKKFFGEYIDKYRMLCSNYNDNLCENIISNFVKILFQIFNLNN